MPTEPTGQLLVFGDSHSVIWGGTDVGTKQQYRHVQDVKTFHLGPAFGFNLLDRDTDQPGKWGTQVLTLIDEEQARGTVISGILLAFGEIDARTQVIRRAIQSGTSIETSAAVIARRICSFAAQLQRRVAAPVPI